MQKVKIIMAYLGIKLSTLRPRLTELLACVERGDHVIIRRHGRAVAAIVPMVDLERIWDHQDEERDGPRSPRTGVRPGRALVGWGARLEREDQEREAARRNGEDKKWNSFWVWARSLGTSD
ncbi:type II toxin-antitoxin system prevent-host-death family antitoxin [Celeribacter sp.]|uniref:type II toxin-antitoxin system prevent-host-death family antitoxin n=1 Tax=Celeribacter sp. TaxID=1890673 RepID=UPI003A91DDDE